MSKNEELSQRERAAAATRAIEEASKDFDRNGAAPTGRANTKRAKDFRGTVKRLVSLLGPWKWWVVLAAVFGLGWVILTVWTPQILGQAVNILFEGAISRLLPAGVTQQQAVEGLRAAGHSSQADMIAAMNLTPGAGVDFTKLSIVLVTTLFMYIGANLLDFLSGYIWNRAVMASIYKLRRDVEAKIHRLPLSFFDRTRRGEIISRVTNDMDNIANVLQQTLAGFINNIMWVAGLLIMMFVTSWKLALIALIIIPIMFVIMGIISPRSQVAFQKQWKETGRLNAAVEETFSAHALVRAFGREESVQQRFSESNEALYHASFRAQFLAGSIMPLMTFSSLLTYVGVAVVGGFQVATGQMRLGSVQAFIQYSQQFNQPLGQLAQSFAQLQSASASAERVFEFLDAAEEEPEDPAAPALNPGPGRIEFQHVDFSYDPAHPLIEDLNLDARPGHTIAIVGPTGAGKTTLVNLIMRFYDIQGGHILLDGQPTADLHRHDVRARVGMVLQDPWLFKGTIKENIRYGREDATDEEIIAAAKATYVDRFVSTLPDGYDTVLEEDAANVSAGERQLITIARAFVSDPAILILDEATSSVDTRTESLLQKAMAALREGRTSFVIAHRLSTIRDANLILVMEHGSIVEQGNHEELLARKGAYYRLYNSQFTGAAIDLDEEASH
ncbi:ABC transporter ATP-binding protein [Neoactinobaculum massilliense]|uniref:ABC transporter ATP-binding protein n=1 Tax=Neoactinobaculum massilliense TaxID=2364794 RepID=UPI0019D17062|nr:ABC transporter ATP-binding protein [Neoactinobaculum massilliense]